MNAILESMLVLVVSLGKQWEFLHFNIVPELIGEGS